MTTKLSVDCSCGGNLIVLTDTQPKDETYYSAEQMFFHDGKAGCRENFICMKIGLSNDYPDYYSAMILYLLNQNNKQKRRK